MDTTWKSHSFKDVWKEEGEEEDMNIDKGYIGMERIGDQSGNKIADE